MEKLWFLKELPLHFLAASRMLDVVTSSHRRSLKSHYRWTELRLKNSLWTQGSPKRLDKGSIIYFSYLFLLLEAAPLVMSIDTILIISWYLSYCPFDISILGSSDPFHTLYLSYSLSLLLGFIDCLPSNKDYAIL